MSPLATHNLARWLAGKSAAAYLAMGDGIAADAQYIHDNYPDLPYVAGYDNGPEAWSDADWALFPKAVHVHIVTDATLNDGAVLDVETGAATPAQAPGWIKARHETGVYRPSIYCNLVTLPAVLSACLTAGLKLGTDFSVWVAQWTGKPHEVPNASAVQYVSLNSIDLSAVYDKGWPHLTAPPKPKPRYVRLVSPGGKTLAELAVLNGVTEDNIVEASEEKLSEPHRTRFENVVAGKLLRGMPYYIKKG